MSYKRTVSFTVALLAATIALNGAAPVAEAAGVYALQTYQAKRAALMKRLNVSKRFTRVTKARPAVRYKRFTTVRKTRPAVQYKRFTSARKARPAYTFKRPSAVKRTVRPSVTRRAPVNRRFPNRVIHSPRYGTDYAGLRQYYSSLAGRRGIDRSPGTDPRATAYRGFQNQGRATAIRGFQNPAQSTAYRGFQNPNRATAYRGFQNQARASRFVRRR